MFWNNKGFTLVELAVVMIIIGLLIGGVLKGVEFIEQARIKSAKSELESVAAAYNQFMDVYRGKPGDLSSATERVLGCDASNFCQNGDGDGDIGNTNSFARTDQTGTALPDVETSMFWKHLALTDMISGVDAGADPSAPTTGVSHLASSLGGAYSVYHREHKHGISIKACPESDVCGVGAVKTSLVAAFDTFYDGEPNPDEGQIIANDGGCLFGQGIYDPDDESLCYVLFQIGY